MNNCPNCNASANRVQQLAEGMKCSVCNTVFKITESGSQIIKRGQSFLGEVAPNSSVI